MKCLGDWDGNIIICWSCTVLYFTISAMRHEPCMSEQRHLRERPFSATRLQVQLPQQFHGWKLPNGYSNGLPLCDIFSGLVVDRDVLTTSSCMTNGFQSHTNTDECVWYINENVSSECQARNPVLRMYEVKSCPLLIANSESLLHRNISCHHFRYRPWII